MLKELFTSLRGALYERAASPLAGSFALVWIAFNWKALAVLLFSSDGILEKIEFIEDTYVEVWRNFYWPAIVTGIFLMIYPLVAAAAFWWSERLDVWQRKVRRKFGLDIPLSPQESLELRERLNEAEKRLADVFSAKEKKVAELEAANQKLSDEISALRPKATPEGVAQARELAEQLEKLRQENLALRTQMSRAPAALDQNGQLQTQERSWRSDFDALSASARERTKGVLRELIDFLANDNYPDQDAITYAIAKGLATKTREDGLLVTDKGRYLAQFIDE